MTLRHFSLVVNRATCNENVQPIRVEPWFAADRLRCIVIGGGSEAAERSAHHVGRPDVERSLVLWKHNLPNPAH